MPRPRFEIRSEDQVNEVTAKAVRFSNGILNQKNRKNVRLDCYSESRTQRSSRRSIIKTRLKDMTYVGKNFGDAHRFSTESCSYSIAIHNKKTGKVRVVPVDLFQLDAWFEGKTSPEETVNSTFREKADALSTEFGSGKSRKAVNKRLRNEMSSEMVSMTTKSVFDSAYTQNQIDASNVINESRSIPPHDKDAKTPDNVYKLKDLISQRVLQCLEEPSRIFNPCTSEQIEKWKEDKTYPHFVLRKLNSLSDRDDARLLQCQILVYLHYLFHVYHMNFSSWRRKCPLPEDWPPVVSDHILSLFSVEVKEPGKTPQRKRTPQHKALLLSHILILCLKLSDFSLDLATIAADLKIAMTRLCTHTRYIGCKTTKSKTDRESYIATLSVPVNFPVVKPKAVKNRIF